MANQTSCEILLTSCLIFTAICCLQGNLTTALVHLRNGQKLFHQWKNASRGMRANGLIDVRAFVALLSRLCTQTIDLRNAPWEDWDIAGAALAELSPEPYTSPVQAYLEFEPICNGFMELRHRGQLTLHEGQPGPAKELRHAYQQALAAWAAKFTHLQTSEALSANDFEGILILEARYLSFYIDLNRDPESEMHWDAFQAEFARIVHLAERVCQISGQDEPSNQRTRGMLATRVFAFSSSGMDAVFTVARYCRHHATRHRALHLLQNWSIKEGICDTKIASVVAAGLTAVEEGPGKTNSLHDRPPGCECDGVFICHDDRIKVVAGEFVEDGKVAMMARTVRDVRLGLPGTFIPVSW
ncbi:hypothetical protein J3458_002668 [Metarhizium acridum]|uniref:uncharacterized protein n=1 Tax=Metarhizium acridum TaxID=92637 RepID=UPI001C6B410F|nr:hypothetical protein J3458_002668 [Metarhizium acridum]